MSFVLLDGRATEAGSVLDRTTRLVDYSACFGMPKKRRVLPPRRKRLKRPARLQAARHWLATFTGKHVVKAYARWFGVDLGCALKELQLLGVPLDSAYVTALQRTLELQRGSRPPQPQSRPLDTGESDATPGYHLTRGPPDN
jgi:hypothetical protein